MLTAIYMSFSICRWAELDAIGLQAKSLTRMIVI